MSATEFSGSGDSRRLAAALVAVGASGGPLVTVVWTLGLLGVELLFVGVLWTCTGFAWRRTAFATG